MSCRGSLSVKRGANKDPDTGKERGKVYGIMEGAELHFRGLKLMVM